jgi:mono/diheme cytochrome c family protein
MRNAAWHASVWAFLGLTALFGIAAAPKTPTDPKALEFFEARVRPVLVEHCFACHGPKKQQAGLRLDSRDSVLKGSDSGPVVVAGAPEKSALVKAINHSGDTKMPPKAKLKPEAIEALTAWVKMGLPWPEGSTATVQNPAGPEGIAEARKKHWAFQPVRPAEPPAVKNAAWCKTPLDRFVLAKLEAKGIRPAPLADRRMLLRRVYFDLIGLPPNAQDVEAALADSADNWFEKVVDRLLASPHYGERWGRHWLDVARYADTKGYVFTEERRFPYAYTYRDYVVRAFNEDLPYDRFVMEQLAADQMPRGDDPRPLAAMGYLTLGRRFLNNIHDIVDDRIDVTMRGLQGLTVTCARCHDHKFDAIPTRDYYSLYGVFVNSVEPKDLPLIAMPEQTEAYRAWERELQAREQKLRDVTQQKYGELLGRLRGQVGDYLIAVRQAEKLPGEDHYEALSAGDLHPEITRRWQAHLAESRKKHDPVFAPWHTFAALPQKEFKDRAVALAEKINANKEAKNPVNPLVAQLFARPPQSLQDVARAYGDLFATTDKLWQEARAKDPAVKKLDDANREALRQILYAEKMPVSVPLADVEAKRLFNRAVKDELTTLKKKVDEWKANTAVAPPRAMVLNDVPSPAPSRVLVRGNPGNPGDAVPRQFLAVLAGEQRKPFAQGSGRLELARAIASPDNPLTARVMVNRIWLHHFGAGLVRTPSDFGTRGDPPTHPELLDYLASRFVQDGWSIKKLHRLILLSSVYQQSSAADANLRTLDPDNRLLARMNRQRLDFEALRDALLSSSGRIDLKIGGPSVDITAIPFSARRTVYAYIERQNLPGIFRTFDLASPDTSSPQRFTTTVPQQALFLMNSPFVVEQAKRLAARPEVADAKEPEKRVEALYRLCYARKPDAEEVTLGLNFVKTAEADKASDSKLTSWEKYAQVLLLANEFAFVD